MKFDRILKLRHLLLVSTLGTELSLRRSADLLNTSQSALSRSLAELEEVLGQKLFERTTRSIKPTQVGHSLIWHARRILGDLARAEADFDALARGATQVLHVGVLSGFSPGFFGRAVADFASSNPDVELRLHDGLAAELFASLSQDRLNLILSHVEIPRGDENIHAQVLYEETTMIVASKFHPLAKRRGIKTIDLANQRWMLPPVGTTVRIAVERELMIATGGPLAPIIETANPHLMASLLTHAPLLTAVPREIARWLVEERDVAVPLKVALSLPTWPVCVARRASSAPTDAETSFFGCLQATVESRQ